MKPSKRFIVIVNGATILLLIPLISMQFTNQVNWSFFDFLIVAILLFSTGLALNFILNKVHNVRKRIALVVILFAILLLIWAELAVGIFGTPFAGN
ncbi:MAG: hypothetical protein HOP11_00230 [Saprospiraceae bacterium]|nr:hypothetical protein [Saprospiraceae bacterium]